jgi:hypothetical protein
VRGLSRRVHAAERELVVTVESDGVQGLGRIDDVAGSGACPVPYLERLVRVGFLDVEFGAFTVGSAAL